MIMTASKTSKDKDVALLKIAPNLHDIPEQLSETQYTVLRLGRVHRMALMVIPPAAGTLLEQAEDAIATLRAVMQQQPIPLTVTMMTLFVRSAEEIPLLRRRLEAYDETRLPATTFVVQSPCGGQALVIEAWGIGGQGVEIDFSAAGMVTVEYDGLKWIYTDGITAPSALKEVYLETQFVFKKLMRYLESAGATFTDVPRVWLYQPGITETEIDSTGEAVERYRELNRSRTDLFDQLEDAGAMIAVHDDRISYPASTGIGMSGGGLTASCMALQSDREEVRLIPLENPNQTAAFDYARRFSAKSPKFSRAMAVLIGHYTTIWVSGTASILDSESVHLGDIVKQTEQTLDNIEALIGPENFRRHGVEGGGACLRDLARVRVYVKRQEDYEKCRAVCERRLGAVPALYTVAEVCRSELLVEIEGVAFSPITTP